MNVYVFSLVWQFDDGDCGHFVETYKSIDDAMDCLKKNMDIAKSKFDGMDTEDDDYVDGDMSYSIWERGEYCYNHVDMKITECEVR